jgi:hypothetical protein
MAVVPDVNDELESLRRENVRLRRLLKLTNAEAAPAIGTQAAWFDKSPGSVDAGSHPEKKVQFYAALFGARTDVYALRWENARSGKSGWMPAVEGGWRRLRTYTPEEGEHDSSVVGLVTLSASWARSGSECALR